MRTTTFLRPGARAALTLAGLVFLACGGKVTVDGSTGGTTTGGGAGVGGQTSTGGFDACVTASDCGFGEIDHEILTPVDCPCLFGCPFIPLSQITVDRRNTQYKQLCTPGVDGQGNGCGIDDCAGPGPAACLNGHCAAAMTP